jgi:hypothetical protein
MLRRMIVAHRPSIIWLLPWIACSCAVAQDLEPRRWTHLPIDTNVLGVTYAYATGDIAVDPAIRLSDVDFRMNAAVVSYVRSFALFDTTARVDVAVPLQSGHWEGLLDGQPAAASRDGLGDPIVRLSVNLLGAPALRGPEYMEYRRQHPRTTVLGAAVQFKLPLGEYREEKLINLGENRFMIRPQIGVLHTNGPWSLELTGSAFFFTDNDDFFGGSRLERDPLYAIQSHVVRTFEGGHWVSAGIAYAGGGEMTIDGQAKDNARDDLLFGVSWGLPIGKSQSLKLTYYRRDTLADSGLGAHNLLLGWSIRF